MSDALSLPPKPEVALALLQTAASVYVHLDPRRTGVVVPLSFRKQSQLVLQVGLNMAVPIPDLDVGEEALSCTLSFNRRAEFCRIPWDAIYGLVGDDGRGMIWPDSIPPEVAAAAEGRAKGAEKSRRLSVVPAPGEGTEAGSEAAPLAEASTAEPAPAERGGETLAGESERPSVRPPKPAGAAPSTAPPPSKRERPSYLRVVK